MRWVGKRDFSVGVDGDRSVEEAWVLRNFLIVDTGDSDEWTERATMVIGGRKGDEGKTCKEQAMTADIGHFQAAIFG